MKTKYIIKIFYTTITIIINAKIKFEEFDNTVIIE